MSISLSVDNFLKSKSESYFVYDHQPLLGLLDDSRGGREEEALHHKHAARLLLQDLGLCRVRQSCRQGHGHARRGRSIESSIDETDGA